MVQRHHTLLEVIEQASWRCREHIYTALEIIALFAVSNTTIHDGDIEIGVLAVFLESFFDLQREFARGLEYEAAQTAMITETLQNRQRKRRSLAGAGLS